MRKINDRQLLEMESQKVPRKAIAAHFHCSEAAVSKRLSRLRPVCREPMKIDRLTDKERAFVLGMVEGKTQTDAALGAYDVTNRTSAKSLGTNLMKNPNIQEALAEIREREIPLKHLVHKLRTHVDAVDPGISLKAVDMGLKLHDAYPSRGVNVDVKIAHIDLSSYSLSENAPQIDAIDISEEKEN